MADIIPKMDTDLTNEDIGKIIKENTKLSTKLNWLHDLLRQLGGEYHCWCHNRHNEQKTLHSKLCYDLRGYFNANIKD